MALGLWIVASLIAAAVTIFIGRRSAPLWAANGNEIATVISFEVYAILVATLLVIYRDRLHASALLLNAAPWRAYALAFALVASVMAALSLAAFLAGAGASVENAYVFVGTDGGRLGLIGPITAALSVGRACLLAPIGEELLFRGAIYGWSRRWLGSWPAIALNGALFAVATGVVRGSLLILVQTFLLGASVNWVRERYNSTLPGVAVHIVHNSAIFIVIYMLMGR